MFNTLPLRAIAFQFIFLLVAIAIEGLILYRFLSIEHKTSMQYSATVNLLSTFVGWLVFFAVQPFIPINVKLELISYFFFERFYTNFWQSGVAPNLVLALLGIFMGTFLIELKGLELLEFALGKNEKKAKEEIEKVGRFRGRKNRVIGIKTNDKTYALLVANACSFSVILILLLARFLDQTRFSVL
ncbi:MAG: hypothetical protein K6T90_08140 [Leptolyngbyaceae cyanobacterium HOT.MB2.61]|jgi:hypothetical protein|nr:hypothetical protein [Leptolyngbyaceae cyanobacterium HOT.MB2.61]